MIRLQNQKTVKGYHNRAHNVFTTGHLSSDLKGLAILGGAVMLISQGAHLLLGVAGVTILARLLTPEDFGLIAMVGSLIGFLSMFSTAGLSMATIQRENVSHEQISTLFWINLTLSALTAGIIAAISPLVAAFYQEPRLTLVTIALGVGLLFCCATIQHQALLSREMRFQSLAVINFIGNVFGLSAAIITAFIKWHYWALVTSSLVFSVTIMLGVWVSLPWTPGWTNCKTGTPIGVRDRFTEALG
jgi:O-antigen/teichoic acid export membrane protein